MNGTFKHEIYAFGFQSKTVVAQRHLETVEHESHFYVSSSTAYTGLAYHALLCLKFGMCALCPLFVAIQEVDAFNLGQIWDNGDLLDTRKDLRPKIRKRVAPFN